METSSAIMAWTAAVGAVSGLLLAAPDGISLLAAFVLAAGWCIKIDREEYAVQMLASDEAALNR